MKRTNRIAEEDLRAFRASLRSLVRKIGRQVRHEAQCCGVGHIMAHVLLELENRNGSSLKDLQEALETDKAALSRAVDFLVKDGLVDRHDNPQNRRTVVLALTPSGKKRVGEINRYTDDRYGRLFELIPAKEHASVLCAVDYLAKAFDDLACESVYPAPKKGGV